MVQPPVIDLVVVHHKRAAPHRKKCDRADRIGNFYKNQFPLNRGDIVNFCDGRVQFALVGIEPSQQKTATLYSLPTDVGGKKYNPLEFLYRQCNHSLRCITRVAWPPTGILCCATGLRMFYSRNIR